MSCCKDSTGKLCKTEKAKLVVSFTQTFARRQGLGKGEGVHFSSGSSNLGEQVIV